MRAAAESQGPDQLGSVVTSPPNATPPSSTSSRHHCPACGRFVGPYERCPTCGARMPGRLAVRTLKLIALALATVGLALVWWAARGLPIPTVSVAEAGGLMNLAYVRMEGRVTRAPTYDPEGGYLGFWIADGTRAVATADGDCAKQ